MNDKGTIVQRLEAEHDYLLEKIQKMQALLERLIRKWRVDGSERLENIVEDAETLLKETKEVRDGKV